jgi:hypothetical protein
LVGRGYGAPPSKINVRITKNRITSKKNVSCTADLKI